MGFRGLVVTACVLLTATFVSSEEWSWGTENPRSSGAARSLHATATPVIPLPPVTQSSKDANNQPQEGEDTQPRFLGISDKLCSLGIGINCKKPHAVRPNSIPVNSHLNAPHRPLSAPFVPAQPLHVQNPPHPAPSHGSGTKVVHHHTHTHIHHTPEGNGVSSHGPGIINTATFQPSHHQLPSHHIPQPLHRPQVPAYREECTCVHSSYCATYDVVARSANGDISNLIDARTRVSDITSNSTSAGAHEETKEDETASESLSRRGKVLGSAESKDETRVRRDTLVAALNSTNDVQGRRLSYTPGVAGCGAAYVCCRNPQLNQPRQPYTCGRRNAQGIVGRVKNPQYINGNTEFGEYPWHVAILKSIDDYVCGGALIDDRHILTAAHCVSSINPQHLKIRLGDWDVSGDDEFYGHIEIPVSFMVIHPQYYAGNLQNDIAVIRMQSYVDFTSSPHISPVCLPDKNYNYFVGQYCASSGWGKNAFGSHGQFQTILQEVELPIVEHHQCEAALRHTRLGHHFSLHQGMLCAGGEEGKDTCEGDGGGPLVCEGADGSIQLAGLVSWGIGCGEHGLPGVYVNIAHYLQWIQTVIRAP